MNPLRITLFGNVTVQHGAAVSSKRMTHQVGALFAYLLTQRDRCHPRQVLAGLFWADYPQTRAQSCLNTALWRLRRVLEPSNSLRGSFLTTTALGEIGFNASSTYWLDVEVFEKEAVHFLARPLHVLKRADVEKMQSALSLYTAPVLDGFYDDWAMRERERMRLLYLKGLAHLMRYYKHHGAYEAGIGCGLRILEDDPLREEIHREIMRLYLKNGQRAQAVRQYEECRATLAAELNIPPMAETQRLYEHLLSGIPQASGPFETVEPPPDLPQAVQELTQALKVLDSARADLARAVKQVERLVTQVKT